MFTDTLTPGSTVVKAIHLNELREATNTLRMRYSLSPFAWTDATIVANVTPVRAVHVTELRDALNTAYVAGRAGPRQPIHMERSRRGSRPSPQRHRGAACGHSRPVVISCAPPGTIMRRHE